MKLGKYFGILLALTLLVAFNAYAADMEEGKTLYNTSCMSCHKDKPSKMIGQPVDDLVTKMKHFKDLANPMGSVEQMQKALKPMSDEQITNIAAYLNGLK